MYEAPQAPLTIGQVLDHGIRLFKASFSSVWLLALVASLAAVPFNAANNQITEQTIETGTVDPNALLMFFLGFLVYIVALLIIYGAIRLRIGGIATGQPITAGEAISGAFRRAPVYFLTGLIYFVIFFFAFLLVIPGIWLGVALVFATYAVFLDNKGPIESIKYSWALVKGNWWRTFVTLMILSLITGVFYMIVVFVIGIIAGMGIEDPADPGPLLTAFEIVVMPMIQVVVLPAFVSLFIALYYDLKLRHEGSDLADRIAAAT